MSGGNGGLSCWEIFGLELAGDDLTGGKLIVLWLRGSR